MKTKATAITILIVTAFMLCVVNCHAEDRYECGEDSQNVTTGDFNNDGYIDFCVNNYKGNSIFVFFNNRNGKFAPPISYSTEKNPNKVAVADINNDGWLDMLVNYYGHKGIDIYLNNGNGSFGEPAKIDPENYSYNFLLPLNAVDINNDGWLDILQVGKTYFMMVLLNNGDGTFGESHTIGSSISSSYPPEITDVDNDGFVDVFIFKNYSVANPDTSFIIILKNKKDGTFHEPVFYKTTSNFSQITLADVDKDGFVDVLCDNPNGNNISIYYNNQDGTFREPIKYDTGIYPLKVTPADIDKDGWIDLLVPNMDSKNLSIFLNKGDGTFKDPTTYTTGVRPREIVVSDLNNDGWLDMIVSCNPSRPDAHLNDIRIYFNKGDGTFTESENYGRGDGFIYVPEIFDINNDGWLDIIQADLGSVFDKIGLVSVFRNLGNGKFDNSGIDLRSDPVKNASSGNNVKIILDLRTFPERKNADVYFVMMNPEGKIYSGMGWNEGISPVLRNLTLPPNVNSFDLTLTEFTIPSQQPPVSGLGAYTFAVGLFKPDTAEMLTFITTTTFEIVSQ